MFSCCVAIGASCIEKYFFQTTWTWEHFRRWCQNSGACCLSLVRLFIICSKLFHCVVKAQASNGKSCAWNWRENHSFSFSTERCKPKMPQKCSIFSMLSHFSFPLAHNIDLFVFVIRCIDWYRYALASGSLTEKFAMSRIVSVFTVVKIRILILVEQYFISSVLASAAVKIYVNAHENEKKISLFSLCWQAVVFSRSSRLDKCELFLHRRNNFQLCYSFEKADTDLQHETGSEYGRQRITMKYFVFERKLARPFRFFIYFEWFRSVVSQRRFFCLPFGRAFIASLHSNYIRLCIRGTE